MMPHGWWILPGALGGVMAWVVVFWLAGVL